MHKLSPRFPKINDNCRRLLIEIIAKYIMTPKLSQRSCQIDLTLQTGLSAIIY